MLRSRGSSSCASVEVAHQRVGWKSSSASVSPTASVPPIQSSSTKRSVSVAVSTKRFGRNRRRSIRAVPPWSLRRCSTDPRPFGSLDPDAAGLVARRFDLVRGAKLEEAWELLRAGDPATLYISERPSPITKSPMFGDEDLVHGGPEHRLDGISPELVDRADLVSSRRSLASLLRIGLL
jgi:hypothetical protein